MGSAGLHFHSGDETLVAVVIGAVLATAGGFLATQLETFVRRRERERGAALLFGEILSVLQLITRLANESRGRGEPYGRLTMRLLRAVRRETDTYDRNREALYDLRDASTRARIHTLMVRVTLALDGVADSTAQIAAAQDQANRLAPDDPALDEARAWVATLMSEREAAFDFAVETVAQVEPIISILRPLAKETFAAHASVAPDA